MNCPYCGRVTDARLDSCPHCGGILRQKAPQSGQQPAAPSARTQVCPNCHALVPEGTIICAACNTNLLTRQKIGDEAPLRPPQRRRLRPWTIVAVVGAIIAIVAIAALTMVLLRDPVKEAQGLIAQGRELRATALLRNHLEKHPEDARAYMLLGRLEWTGNNYSDAARAFEEVTELVPTNEKATLYTFASLAAQARGTVSPRQISLLEQICRQQPRDADMWFMLALAQGIEKQTDQQVQSLQRVLDIDPDYTAAKLHLGIAEALLGQQTEARTQLAAALADEPDNGDIQAALGMVAALGEDTEAARESLNRAIDLESSVQEFARLRLGLLLMEEEQYGPAIGYLQDLAEKDVTNYQARFFVSVCRAKLGQEEAALKEYNALARLDGPFAIASAVEAAKIHLEDKNISLARESVDRAMQLGGNTAEIQTLHGVLLAQNGQDNDAQDAFSRAAQIDPTYPPAHLESGLLYVRRQMLDEGLRELNSYMELAGPTSPAVANIRPLVQQLQQTLGVEG